VLTVRPYLASQPLISATGRQQARHSRSCILNAREICQGASPGGVAGNEGGRGRPSIPGAGTAAKKSGSQRAALRASDLARGAKSTIPIGPKVPPRSVKMSKPLAIMLKE
jgi:hypothetical protein